MYIISNITYSFEAHLTFFKALKKISEHLYTSLNERGKYFQSGLFFTNCIFDLYLHCFKTTQHCLNLGGLVLNSLNSKLTHLHNSAKSIWLVSPDMEIGLSKVFLLDLIMFLLTFFGGTSVIEGSLCKSRAVGSFLKHYNIN